MGIFDREYGNLFTTYRAEVVFRDRIMGGVPRDPKMIEGWLKTRAGISEQAELRQAMVRTLSELGELPSGELRPEEVDQAIQKIAYTQQTNGFKSDEDGLYIEGRQVKALLKEAINILFAGEKWGQTKKGPRNFAAERVFVDPDRIHMGIGEPSGIHLFIGHVTDKQGPRATLTYFEYAEQARMEFQVRVTRDGIEAKHWPLIWVQAQELGLGALRSQGYGRFDIEGWERIEEAPALKALG